MINNPHFYPNKSRKNPYLHNLLLVFVALGLFSCTEEVQPIPEEGRDYFPTQLGTWVEFECDSIWQDAPVNVRDTFRFYRRDLIESNIVSTRDTLIQRIERYKKAGIADTWTLKDVWFQSKSLTSAERVEENIRFVKLKFPLSEGLRWDGNLFNFEDAWNYKVTKLHQPFDINGLHFDSTVTIEQIDSVNLVQRLYGKEVWAKHVGLVYKKYVKYQVFPGGQDSVLGTEYEYRAINFGIQ